MGFFGVLADSSPPPFEVGRLDLNLWCLPRRFRQYAFFCDLGIELAATTSVQQLSVAVPFQSTATIIDLAEFLRREEIAGLIFGEPVNIMGGGQWVEVKNEKLRICQIDENSSYLDMTRSGPNFSLWRLCLSPAITPGEKSYLRVRLAVRSLGRFWVWHPSRGGGRAAVADVRVADLREAAVLRHARDYATRLAAIRRLNCFIMVPVGFEHRFCSPPVRYLRLLEAEVWRDYLPDKSAKHKLLVHYWQVKEGVAVGSEFRGVLNVRSAPPRLRGETMVTAIVTAVFVVLLLLPPGAVPHSTLVRGATSLLSLAQLEKFWTWVYVVSGVIVVWLVSNPDTARTLWGHCRRLLSWSWHRGKQGFRR